MMLSGNDFPKNKFSVVDGRSRVTEMVWWCSKHDVQQQWMSGHRQLNAKQMSPVNNWC